MRTKIVDLRKFDLAGRLVQMFLNTQELPLKNTNVAVLGVSYKRNVDDPRESPFYKVRDLLVSKGAKLSVYDSWYRYENTADTLDLALQDVEAILLVTEHSDIVDKLHKINLMELDVKIIIDGRNALDGNLIEKQGVVYRGIGRASTKQVSNAHDGFGVRTVK